MRKAELSIAHVGGWLALTLVVAAACNDRVVHEAPREWPPPVEIAQDLLHPNCAVIDGVAKCWSEKPLDAEPTDDDRLFLQREELHPEVIPPVDFGPGEEVAALSSSLYQRCAVLGSGAVKCWGNNTFFALGQPDEMEKVGDTPDERGANMPAVLLGAEFEVAQVVNREGGGCARSRAGRVKCWGSGSASLGLGDTQARGDDGPSEMGDALPYVDLGTDVRAVGITRGTCIWTEQGQAKCWGSNERGRLGVVSPDWEPLGDEPGEMGAALPFIDLGTDIRVVQVSGGTLHACALTDDGRIKCWGGNSSLADLEPPAQPEPFAFGRLGYGDRDDRLPPLGDALPYVELGRDFHAVAVRAESNHTCAVSDEGRVKCWGERVKLGLGLGAVPDDDLGDEPGEMGDNLSYVDFGDGHTVQRLGLVVAMLDDGTAVRWPYGKPKTGDLFRVLATPEQLFVP